MRRVFCSFGWPAWDWETHRSVLQSINWSVQGTWSNTRVKAGRAR